MFYLFIKSIKNNAFLEELLSLLCFENFCIVLIILTTKQVNVYVCT